MEVNPHKEFKKSPIPQPLSPLRKERGVKIEQAKTFHGFTENDKRWPRLLHDSQD
jgi:hypothetical protein